MSGNLLNARQLILVTGAGGFVGSALVARLVRDGFPVRAAIRRRTASAASGAETAVVGDISARTDWRRAVEGASVVVHCAARVHMLRDDTADPLAAFRSVNVEGTVALARQAAEAGVGRFVFISSIGVNGAETFGQPFRADDEPAPHSPYARSKMEAEAALRRLSAETGMGVTVVRPPLVYGSGAPGNFGTLLRAVDRGVPLPLGAIRNRRSFVALGNLVDLIVHAMHHDAAAGKTLLVSDGEDLSTSELLRRTARALGRPSRLLPVPESWVRSVATILGRAEMGRQLCGSLQVEMSSTCQTLQWRPPMSVDDGLRIAVDAEAGASRERTATE